MYFDKFINQYGLSKTLRFKLTPVGATQTFIEERGILDRDETMANDYKRAKELIDDYHRYFIDDVLTGLKIDWADLASALQEYQRATIEDRDKAKKTYEDMCARYRKEIRSEFKKDKRFSQLFGKDMLTDLLPKFLVEVNKEEEQPLIEGFKNFATYFVGFWENRNNMYLEEEKSSAIPYRIVNENFPKFISNCNNFENIKHLLDMGQLEKLCSILGIDDIDEYFCINGFNNVLSQNGIDVYNQVIGGVVQDEHISGINQQLNLAFQQGKTTSRLRLAPLFKQVLSDRGSASFSIDFFEDDEQLLNSLDDFFAERFQDSQVIEKTGKELFRSLGEYDKNYIYVKSSEEHSFSKIVCENLFVISDALEDYKQSIVGSKATKKAAKMAETWRNSKQFSLKEIETALMSVSQRWDLSQVESAWIKRAESVNKALEEYKVQVNISDFVVKRQLRQDEKAMEAIKNLLDAVMDLYQIPRIFSVSGTVEKDTHFYSELEKLITELDSVVPLYNKIRNYLTKKPYSVEKYKLNFNCSQLLNGWDMNKEPDCLGTIFRREGRYYLGIINKDDNKCLVDIPTSSNGENLYEKMFYKLIPGPNKMLPKVVFAKSNSELFNPPAEILRIRESGSFKKGNSFSLEDCHALIDFYKACLKKYPNWTMYDLRLSGTESYSNIAEFYKEVADQSYKLWFEQVDDSYIENLIETGKLYLFELDNKDFSSFSTGSKNLHTLYFEALFNESNLVDPIFKLSGNAEVFFRPKSIENPFIHKKGSLLVNRTYKDNEGNTCHIDNEVYKELLDVANGKIDVADVSADAKELWESGRIGVRKAPHDIVKNKRYARNQYQLHLPIEINYKATGNGDIDKDMREFLYQNSDVNIIGIDRGERHLLYVSVINQQGKILEQRSLNILDGVNYREKLDLLEKNRQQARKSWKSIKAIKDLKKGYLSAVVHTIVQLMLKYNAVVVMEDLNSGFKRGRLKIEKQVYQNFEKQLIEKLNYCALKPGSDDSHRGIDEPGGILQGYQLSSKFQSFKAMGKQSGAIFYVRPWMTSHIDPTTGFVNLFRRLKYENVKKAKDFFSRFESIRYNAEADYFEFVFNYAHFDTNSSAEQSRWTVCSYGDRLVTRKNRQNHFEVVELNVTDKLKSLFKREGISYEGVANLYEHIQEVSNTDFWKTLTFLFKTIVQMRYSAPSGNYDSIDYILSPVMNAKGVFFDSRKADSDLPQDADANGAYHIALKGLMLLTQQLGPDKSGDRIVIVPATNSEWLNYAQGRVVG